MSKFVEIFDLLNEGIGICFIYFFTYNLFFLLSIVEASSLFLFKRKLERRETLSPHSIYFEQSKVQKERTKRKKINTYAEGLNKRNQKIKGKPLMFENFWHVYLSRVKNANWKSKLTICLLIHIYLVIRIEMYKSHTNLRWEMRLTFFLPPTRLTLLILIVNINYDFTVNYTNKFL